MLLFFGCSYQTIMENGGYSDSNHSGSRSKDKTRPKLSKTKFATPEIQVIAT